MSKETAVDTSYKSTQAYLKLRDELAEFEKKDWRDCSWSEELIGKYKQFYSYPVFSKIQMPSEFIGISFYNFKTSNRPQEMVVEIMETKPWQWYMITGKPGIGKTHLAIACMVKSISDSKKPDGKYDTAEAMFLRIKSHNGCEEEVVENYSAFAVLVIDECEAEKITSFNDNSIKGVFQEIIRRRDIAKKQTIVIGNNKDEVLKLLGKNGESRFNGGGEILELQGEAWVDYRPKKKVELNKDGNTPF
jgi:DNA replication protein DnaC